MKKFSFIIVIALLFLLPLNIKAADIYTINGKASIRTQPNEGGTFLVPGSIHYLDPSDVVVMVDNNKIASTNSKCSSYYYHVSYSGNAGYVCGDFINFKADETYYAELRKAGFPESYLLQLNDLKLKHPNWVFTPYNTNLNFNDVVDKQSIVGKSLIQVSDPNGSDKVLLSLAGGSYDANSKTFIQKEAGGWYAANASTIAYYIDPRNFINERDIYMFEKNTYNSANQTASSVNGIFSGTKLLNYTNDFIKAAKDNGNDISPTMLAARSRLEVVVAGGELSNSANGKNGYYNFFNIGAYSSCVNPVLCGSNYAAGKGWTSPSLAVLGGANFIDNYYVKKGQNTLYFQKYNVTGYNTYSNQYMTNIKAPRSEANYLYQGYNSASLVNTTTYFIIPIFNNMPASAALLPTTMNQAELAQANESTKQTNNTLSINAIVNGSGYKYETGYISNISQNTTVQTLATKLKNMSSSSNITITSDGKTITGDAKLGTGDIVKITNNGKTESLRVIVYGDTSGDGDINVIDLLRVQKHILQSSTLIGSYEKAADTNRDGKIDVIDLLRIQKHILGISEIN